MTASDAAASPRSLRRCLGHFATGVVVVTYDTENGPRGVTINSFTSISTEPPLVMVSLARDASAANHLDRTSFTVNVLSSTQVDVARQFAGQLREAVEVPWSPAPGVSRLSGTVAWLECRPWATYDGGDHLIYLGRVAGYGSRHEEPLLFHRGQFRAAGTRIR